MSVSMCCGFGARCSCWRCYVQCCYSFRGAVIFLCKIQSPHPPQFYGTMRREPAGAAGHKAGCQWSPSLPEHAPSTHRCRAPERFSGLRGVTTLPTQDNPRPPQEPPSISPFPPLPSLQPVPTPVLIPFAFVLLISRAVSHGPAVRTMKPGGALRLPTVHGPDGHQE